MSPSFPHAAVFLAVMTTAAALRAADTSYPDPQSLPANPSLPEALVSGDGQRVTTREAWQEKRAPELRRLFQHYEYGTWPETAKVTAKVTREDKAALGGKATLREITLSLSHPEGGQIHLLLVTPNDAKKPSPVFLGLNFNGNLALLPDPQIFVPPGWKSKKGETLEQSRGSEADKWALDQSIAHGYAVATFWNSEFVPDDKDAAEAMLQKLRPAGSTERGPSDTATIAAWAWCLSRAVDYLVTDPALDAKRIAVVGHSRNGKTALLAAAFDERIALVVPSQAGCGGSAPCRVSAELSTEGANGRSIVETVKRINTSFPHWFSGNFKAFNTEPAKLPFDQHELIALCAPRPVLLSCATEDLWANPAGQFDMLRAADPVYKLVAGDGLGATQMPEVSKLLPSRLGYYIRPGKHSMTREDWAVWLDYADKWMR
ncbi:MAG: acetylxylan esterase [Chthoniobacter sp.]|uniref:glucuronyl esterase domain-containing protein n=1 Tax=Chthoniobacter sp. TaxID=2510640 RepID=UPI0032A42BD5